jgi:hypothetical protein
MKDELEALAARVEAATGASFMLDAEIGLAVFGGRRTDVDGVIAVEGRAMLVKPYTASLDAAMSLVPEGLRLTLSEWDDEKHLRPKGPWQAILSRPGCDASFDAMRGYRCDHAATPALALTAACLRARATTDGEQSA